MNRPEVDRDSWDGVLDFARASARRAAARRAPGRRTGRWTCSALAKDAAFAAGTGGRGRGPGRPRHERGAAQRPVRVRPGAAAGQAAGRRARRRAGPAGHQGRHRRRRADGEPARAAVRPAPRGPGGADRPRPGPGRQGRPMCTARSTSCRPRAGSTRARRPSCAAWSPAASTRPRSPTPTSSSRPSSRTSRQEAGLGRAGEDRPPDCVLATNTSSLSVTAMAADLEHPERVVGLHFFNPVARDAAAGDRAGASGPTTPRWPPRSRSARRCEVVRAGQGRARRSWSTGC